MGYRIVNFMFDFDVFTEEEVENLRKGHNLGLQVSDKVYSTTEEAQIEADRLAEEMDKETPHESWA